MPAGIPKPTDRIEEIQGLPTRLETIEGDVSAVAGEVVAVAGEVATVAGTVTVVQGDVTTLSGGVAQVQGDIAAVSEMVGAIQSESVTDRYFLHNQIVASQTWIITHNMAKNPAITVIDSSGNRLEGNWTYDSINQVTLQFSAPCNGHAYLS